MALANRSGDADTRLFMAAPETALDLVSLLSAHLAPRPGKRRRRKRGGQEYSPRSRILAGAARVFGERGFSKSSVEHILRAAGVSRRTFYRFFKNKEDVLVELFDTASLLLVQSIRSAAMVGRTPEQKIDNCIEVYLRGPQVAGPLFQVLNAEGSRPGSRLAERRAQAIEQIVDLLGRLIFDEQQRHVDPLLLHALIAGLEQVSRSVFARSPVSEAEFARAKRVMVHMFASCMNDDVPLAEADPDAD